MKRSVAVVAAWLLVLAVAWGQAPPAAEALLDWTDANVLTRVVPGQPDQVTLARAEGAPGVVATCHPGKNAYPGLILKPEGPVWDLSRFGHVEARVVNLGAARLNLSLRVDNAGDWTLNPWSSEAVWLKPGEATTIRVRFGYSWGKPGFALDAAKIPQMLLFAAKSEADQVFRLEALTAGGVPGEKPPVNPWDVRTRPTGGVLLGPGAAADAVLQTAPQGGAKAELAAADETGRWRMVLPAGVAAALVQLKPAVGMWDLRDWLQVTVHLRNDGPTPITPRARLDSRGRAGDWVTAAAPLAPGAEQDLVLPFAGGLMTINNPGTPPTGGSSVESDAVSGLTVSAAGDGERTLTVTAIRAQVPPPPALPDWLGKRPPVPGEWTPTLAEEFDQPTINEGLWSIYHPNYWDKRSHFSKSNVLLGEGVVRLRFEKKRGPADDDPAKPETDWATGFLTGTHKWRQRYGYFECRMKLPRAPGLWPAFWMMPDRGPEAGPARESTADGGMEFDILEYLVRYGPYRYNLAMHWDNYGKDHKSTGTDRIYFQPDSQGFVTAGLLWEPGRATFYANGTAVAQWTNPRVSSVPEYILFTAVSGGWGGNDLTGEGLPDDYVLDYVRAWQRADWAEAGGQ